MPFYNSKKARKKNDVGRRSSESRRDKGSVGGREGESHFERKTGALGSTTTTTGGNGPHRLLGGEPKEASKSASSGGGGKSSRRRLHRGKSSESPSKPLPSPMDLVKSPPGNTKNGDVPRVSESSSSSSSEIDEAGGTSVVPQESSLALAQREVGRRDGNKNEGQAQQQHQRRRNKARLAVRERQSTSDYSSADDWEFADAAETSQEETETDVGVGSAVGSVPPPPPRRFSSTPAPPAPPRRTSLTSRPPLALATTKKRRKSGTTSTAVTNRIPQPLGMINLGNTCYLNAGMQMLLSLPHFVADLCTHDYHYDAALARLSSRHQIFTHVHVVDNGDGRKAGGMQHGCGEDDDCGHDSLGEHGQHRQMVLIEAASDSDDEDNEDGGGQDGEEGGDGDCITKDKSPILHSLAELAMRVNRFHVEYPHLSPELPPLPLSSTGEGNGTSVQQQQQLATSGSNRSGKNGSVDPTPLKAVVDTISPQFVGYQQQDSHEFVTQFMDALHEEMLNVHRQLRKDRRRKDRQRRRRQREELERMGERQRVISDGIEVDGEDTTEGCPTIPEAAPEQRPPPASPATPQVAVGGMPQRRQKEEADIPPEDTSTGGRRINIAPSSTSMDNAVTSMPGGSRSSSSSAAATSAAVASVPDAASVASKGSRRPNKEHQSTTTTAAATTKNEAPDPMEFDMVEDDGEASDGVLVVDPSRMCNMFSVFYDAMDCVGPLRRGSSSRSTLSAIMDGNNDWRGQTKSNDETSSDAASKVPSATSAELGSAAVGQDAINSGEDSLQTRQGFSQEGQASTSSHQERHVVSTSSMIAEQEYILQENASAEAEPNGDNTRSSSSVAKAPMDTDEDMLVDVDEDFVTIEAPTDSDVGVVGDDVVMAATSAAVHNDDEVMTDTPNDEHEDGGPMSSHPAGSEDESDSEDEDEDDDPPPPLPTDHFCMEINVRLVCDNPDCRYTRNRTEFYRHLSLDISPNASTIEEALKNYFAPETREIKCESKGCECESATQYMEIVTMPRALLLHLKRFLVEWDPKTYNVKVRKNGAKVEFRERVDLKRYLCPERKGGVVVKRTSTRDLLHSMSESASGSCVAHGAGGREEEDKNDGEVGERREEEVFDPRQVLLGSGSAAGESTRSAHNTSPLPRGVSTYRLKSVVHHIGSSASCGHYVADAAATPGGPGILPTASSSSLGAGRGRQLSPRHGASGSSPLASQRDSTGYLEGREKWCRFNDHLVRSIPLKDVMGGESRSTAYMLMYELDYGDDGGSGNCLSRSFSSHSVAMPSGRGGKAGMWHFPRWIVKTWKKVNIAKRG